MNSKLLASTSRTAAAALCAAGLSIGAVAAGAEEALEPRLDAPDGVEVVRGGLDLRNALAPAPDLDVVDTALVFHNPRGQRTIVGCAGFSAEGKFLGRAYARIPANGLRLILASDLSDGIDFVGSARCASRSRVIPSAFIVGAGFSDAPAHLTEGWDDTSIRFPVVAHY